MPHLKGLVKQVTPCVYAWFCLGILPAPQEGRICVATSDFVALLGIPNKEGLFFYQCHFPIHLLDEGGEA